MILLLSGLFITWVILIVGIPLFITSYLLINKKLKGLKQTGSSKEQNFFLTLALIFVFLWVVGNSLYSSQNIFIYRDPAIYAVQGQHLINNNNFEIQGSNVFGNDKEIVSHAVSFLPIKDQDKDPDRLYMHGMQMLPVYLGIAGRLVGGSMMLHLNPLFGGLALLALYGFAVLFIKPKWALLSILLFGVTLPLIYFSRDNYTEPLTTIFVFSGLSMFVAASQKNSRTLWLVAGIIAGASALTRIDAYLVIAGFMVASILRLVWLKNDNKQLKSTIVYLISCLLVMSIGYTALTSISARYYSDLRSGFMQQLALLVAAVVSCFIFVMLIPWLKKIFPRTRNGLLESRAIILQVMAFFSVIILASRPFWYVGKDIKQNPLVAILQNAEGKMIEPRNYSEQTLNWLWWYIGPIAAILALYAFLYVLGKVTFRKHIKYIPIMCIFIITTTVYLLKPAITPDQIWAARRFLPVTIPFLAFFTAMGLGIIVSKLNLTNDKYRIHKKFSVALLIIMIFLGPLFITQPFITTRVYAGQLAQIKTICNSLPENPALLMVGTNGYNLMQPLRTYCNIPAELLIAPKSNKQIEQAINEAEAKGYSPVIVVDGHELALVETEKYTLRYISSGIDEDLVKNLYNPPRNTITEERNIYFFTK